MRQSAPEDNKDCLDHYICFVMSETKKGFMAFTAVVEPFVCLLSSHYTECVTCLQGYNSHHNY